MQLGFTASDRREWDVVRGFMSPDVRIDLDRAGGWRLGFESEYRGLDGYIQWFEMFTEFFAGWDTSELEVVAPAGPRVLAISRPTARGAGSGVPVTGELWVVFTYERGWLTRIQPFSEPDEAFATVGLKRREPAS
jgi:hypothetical protein